ncbi:hypothetical protein HMF8227_02695 [Saliniradius amylolyticus]|uniref:Uncharacterized protein n=1 Tax=Saliniradius amylolyticus TaxID=2183582 RepID=A0A2S2E875_9ALTE|nr:hypothetical protein HMF8227_02695 [Saliniradius amylolyticus]
MLSKLSVIVLVFSLSVQSLGWSMPSDSHHSVSDQAHQWLHHLGQSHTHDEHDQTQFEISYSEAGFDHSNPHQDTGTVAIIDLVALRTIERSPGPAIESIVPNWAPPDLEYLSPPPKA